MESLLEGAAQWWVAVQSCALSVACSHTVPVCVWPWRKE